MYRHPKPLVQFGRFDQLVDQGATVSYSIFGHSDVLFWANYFFCVDERNCPPTYIDTLTIAEKSGMISSETQPLCSHSL